MVRSTVHLLRHGEVFNPEGILYGRLAGFHLSARGYAMADMVAKYFSDRAHQGDVFGCIEASPLLRTQETARPTAEALGLNVETDERLIEAGNRFEGQQMVSKVMLLPRNLRYLYNPFRPSWGEPYRQQARRMHQAIAAARNKSLEVVGDGAHAILISHQLPIWLARRHAEGRGLAHRPNRRQCALASVTSLSFEGAQIVGVEYKEPAGALYST